MVDSRVPATLAIISVSRTTLSAWTYDVVLSVEATLETPLTASFVYCISETVGITSGYLLKSVMKSFGVFKTTKAIPGIKSAINFT